MWVVWPAGASYESTGEHQANVRLADGTEIGPGMQVEIVGALITRSDLPDGDNPQGQWGQHAGFCIGQPRSEGEILRAESVTLR